MALDQSEDSDLSLKVANSFCNDIEDIIYCLEEDCFYLYEKGIYKKIFDREMHDLVLTKKALTRKMSLQGLKNVIDRIATIKRCHVERFNNHGMINLENGLFNIEKGELEYHSPSIISTVRLPYSYREQAACPLWEKTINEITENDKNKIRTIQEFFGYCLTREVKHEKALILIGEGGTGKSTILNTLKHMVGTENCSALSLRYFSNPQKASVLKHKLVNICTEVPKKIEDFEDEFRKIVTGEDLQISPKYVPDYDITPCCKLVMAINEFPYIDDKTNAFYRRLLLIELKREFKEEEQNKDLKDELLKELPGIFNWAYQGYKDLEQRGRFLIDEYMKVGIEHIKEMNNPIISWAKDNLLVINGQELVKTEAFDSYRKWSEKNGYKPFGANKFGAEIFRIFCRNTEKDRRCGLGERPRVWPNLAFRTPENELKFNRTEENIEWQE